MKSEELYQGSGVNCRIFGTHGLKGFGEGLIQELLDDYDLPACVLSDDFFSGVLASP
ncbi:MAG: hypothetical protein ABSE73_28680 [Planctomycetota bacterium]